MLVWGAHGLLDRFQRRESRCLDIGLVNNMPGKAFRNTERQFARLLDSAAPEGVTVRLWLFALPDLPPCEASRPHRNYWYSSIEDLWDTRLDGLIVTGTEPRAGNLTDEPYWMTMTRLIEWADRNTHSSIWSCLAAHAAVLHLDGLERRRFPEKRSGVFECDRACENPLTTDLPARFAVPHSRWNEISEKELTACGYRILTRSHEAGADAFTKLRNSLFVFLQGHPEYDADTLLLEYMRDVRRYLKGATDRHPSLPAGYLDQASMELIRHSDPEESLARLAAESATFPKPWELPARQIYRNWLTFLLASKEQRQWEHSHSRYVA